MIFEVKDGQCFVNGVISKPRPGILVKSETGERIPFARFFNTDTGEWEAFDATADGKAILKPVKKIRGKCPIRFIESAGFVPKLQPCVRRSFVGPELTQAQKAAEIRKIALDYGFKEIIATPGMECETPRCHKLARWMTGDEQIIDPEVNSIGEFERAFTKRVHRFCDDCFRLPVQTSIRGVESEIEVATRHFE